MGKRVNAFASVAALACFASCAAAAPCGDQPLGYLFPVASAKCSAFTACGSHMCACAGSPLPNATACLGAATVGCSIVEACVASYNECLGGIAQLTVNASSPCFTLASSVHFAQLAAASGYEGSRLQASCRHHSCVVANASSASCAISTAAVCRAPPPGTTTATAMASTAAASTAATTRRPLVPETTHASSPPAASTAPPPTTTVSTATPPAGTLPFAPAMTATLRIEGSAFEALLLPWKRAALEAAIRGDLARLLRTAETDVYIQRLVLGSLVVDFAVSADAGVPPSDLAGRLMAVTQGNWWLAATQEVYGAVSDERLVVATAPVLTSSAAPGVVTALPTPTPTFPLALIGSPAAAPSGLLPLSLASGMLATVAALAL